MRRGRHRGAPADRNDFYARLVRLCAGKGARRVRHRALANTAGRCLPQLEQLNGTHPTDGGVDHDERAPPGAPGAADECEELAEQFRCECLP
jgi:hypothetical protein